MSRLHPYRNWTTEELRIKLLDQINPLEIDPRLKSLWINIVNDAIVSDLWDPIEDYNGCTALQDFTHPDPACFVHDYMWICGYGGFKADKIFKALMKAQGRTKWSYSFRRFAVSVGWSVYYMWKNIFNRNVNPYTKNILKLYKYVK